MPKQKLHFQVLPLPVVKKKIESFRKLALNSIDCAVCGDPVSLEDSKTNEHGKAVHEDCYVKTATGMTSRNRREGI